MVFVKGVDVGVVRIVVYVDVVDVDVVYSHLKSIDRNGFPEVLETALGHRNRLRAITSNFA